FRGLLAPLPELFEQFRVHLDRAVRAQPQRAMHRPGELRPAATAPALLGPTSGRPGRGGGRRRPDGVEEAARPAGGTPTGATAAAPRERQVLPRTGDAHVQQAPLLLDRVRTRVDRVADGHPALVDADEEDGIPLEALGSVER